MRVSLIAACDEENGIGFKNDLPWKLKEEFKYFQDVTKSSKKNKMNALIMGRKNWESLYVRPLKGRINVVLTRNIAKFKEKWFTLFENNASVFFVFDSIPKAIKHLKNMETLDKIFVAGGGNVYSVFLNDHTELVEKIYLTRIFNKYDCDVFFPKIDTKVFKKDEKYLDGRIETDEKSGTKFRYELYVNNNV